MNKSKVQWTDYMLNFFDWHCIKVSPGCSHCYAERKAKEFGKVFRGNPNWRENALTELCSIPPGSLIFVNGFSDTYHEGAPIPWIARIHDVIVQSPQYIFLLLTKRPERALALSHLLKWPENLWLGVSVEGQNYVSRIDLLRKIPAAHRFVSFEPLLGTVTANLKQVEWAICGGESGTAARYMDREWAKDLWEQCRSAHVPYFFKQASGEHPGYNRTMLGGLVEEFPAAFTELKKRYEPNVSQMELF